MEVIVPSKLVYFTYLWDLQSTYRGVVIHLITKYLGHPSTMVNHYEKTPFGRICFGTFSFCILRSKFKKYV